MSEEEKEGWMEEGEENGKEKGVEEKGGSGNEMEVAGMRGRRSRGGASGILEQQVRGTVFFRARGSRGQRAYLGSRQLRSFCSIHHGILLNNNNRGL